MAVVISFVGKFDSKDLNRAQRELAQLGKTADGTGRSVADSFKDMAAKAAIVGAAVGGAFLVVNKAIQAASDLAESQSKVGVVFGENAETVRSWARTSATAFGISEQAALEAAGTYGNLFQSFGLGRQEATSMSTSLVQLAADLASFNNTSIDDAIEALRSGLSGETEPLKRFGIALNDARLKAEALAQGIYEGTGTLNAAQKAQAAYALILKDTTLAQGDFARTSDGLANQQRILQAQFQNLIAQLGQALIPVALKVVSILNGGIGVVSGFANAIRDNAEVVKIAAAAVAALAASIAVQAYGARAAALANAIFTGSIISMNTGLTIANALLVATNALMRALPWVAIATGLALFITKLDEGAEAQAKYREETERTLRTTGQLRDENGRFTKEAIALGLATRGARNAQKDHGDAISGTVSSAMALGNTLPKVTDKTYDAADAAQTAAQSYITMWEAIVQSQRQSRDLANTSGTVSSAIAEGVTRGADLTEARLREIRESLDGVARSARGGGAAAKQQVEKVAELRREWRDTAASITADVDGLSVTLSTRGEEISKTLADRFTAGLGAFKAVVTEQQSIIRQAQDALDSYSKSVVDTILGGIRIQTEDAEGNALTPEQIVTALFGGVENRRKAVEAVAAIATEIPAALAQQLVSLTSTDPQGAIALANYLANNPAQVAQLTANYNSLSEFTKTALGDPMAVAFAQVGDESAVTMLANARRRIAQEAEDFQRWVASKLRSRVIVEVEYRAINSPPAAVAQAASAPRPAGRARGGSVSSATPYLVGEVGPELFIPGRGGTIIPNDQLAGASGGNTYNITVQAGVGDPRQIGQQIVEYVRRFEDANGRVFAAAS